MSHEIVYDKQFIKLADNNYIPMLYWGSNNCTEISPKGKERRERSWSTFKYHCGGNGFYDTPENLLKSVDEFKVNRAERYKDDDEFSLEHLEKSFGYYVSMAIGGSTRRTSFGMYRGMFTTGIKKALTVEELLKTGFSVCVYSWVWEDKTYKEKGIEPFRIYPSTSEELKRVLDEKTVELKDTGIDIHLSGDISEWKRKQNKLISAIERRNKSQKVWMDVDSYVILQNDKGCFVKNTKYGYRYTSWYNSAKQFVNMAAANRFLNSDRMRGSSWKPVLINEKTRLKLLPKKAKKNLVV